MTDSELGEVGSAVLSHLAGAGGSPAPWWVVLGIGGLVAALVVWALWAQGGVR